MIPLRLTIQGLFSYQEKQVIDFTKLTSAHLFGIFGAVGSGKSSILEAITFALYGETDRLNARGDSRNYNMMNLKSSDLLIEFDFEAGKEQTGYKAVVKGRRNRKKFEDVDKFERLAYRKENGSLIPIEPESLKDIIGLTYANFKRTIIIPQGQFQEFLQLTSTDRTRMMRELFNLEKFEMDGKVSSLERKNEAQKQNLDGKLQQLGAVDQAQVLVFQEKAEVLKKGIALLTQSINEGQKQENELKLLSDLVSKKEEAAGKLLQLNIQLPEIEKLEKQISDFEYCLIHFKPVLDSIVASSQKMLVLEKQIADESLKLKQAEGQITLAENLFGKIKPEYEAREKLRQKAEELEKVLRLSELRNLTELSKIRQKNGEEFVQKTVTAIEMLRQEKETLEAKLLTEKEKQPDMLSLSNARSWHEAQANLVQQIAANSAEEEKVKGELAELQKQLSELFKNACFEGFAGEADYSGGMQFLKDKNARLKAHLAEAETHIQHYKVQLKLEEFAVKLQDGEACPVCGSLHHPDVLVAADVAEKLKSAENEEQKLEKEIQACEQLGLRLAEFSNLYLLNKKQMDAIREKRKEIDANKAAHEQAFQWEKYRAIDAITEAFRLAELLKKSIELLEKRRGETNKKYDQELQNKEKYQREIDKINAELVAFKAETETLTGQIKLIDLAEYQDKLKSEIETEKRELLQKYADLEKQFSHLSNQLQELRKSKDVLNGSLSANGVQADQEKAVLEQLNQKLEKELVSSDFDTVDAVRQVIGLNMNVAEKKQKVSNFKQEISVTKSRQEQLAKEIGDRIYDRETHRQLQEQLERERLALDQKNRELGITEKSLADLQKSLETQAQLRKELEQIELRGENIKTLKKLFAASGFVNYISSVYLQNLCNAANDRFFQLTRQKLSLEITDDNNFQVRDYLNGGKVRSVKTLSGGQTFQAALCLALALADNIQKITESNQNFFFLDEGFGSLDKDSLAVVFETLKSLRKENRIVGVISHVEEMQQEIDTHLKVVNHEETGSRILASWML